MEDQKHLLGQLANLKSSSSLRKLHHEASSCPTLVVLLEALPEPGCLEAHRPSNFLQALNHSQFISDCVCANIVLPLEQLFSLLSVQPRCVHSEDTCLFSSHTLHAQQVQLCQRPPRPAPCKSKDPSSLPPHPQRFNSSVPGAPKAKSYALLKHSGVLPEMPVPAQLRTAGAVPCSQAMPCVPRALQHPGHPSQHCPCWPGPGASSSSHEPVDLHSSLFRSLA